MRTRDNREAGASPEVGARQVRLFESSAPEPPAGFDPQRQDTRGPVPPQGPHDSGPDNEFERLRKVTSIAQILALVSLIIGGIVLSAVALVMALTARSKVAVFAQGKPGADAMVSVLEKSVKAAIIMSVLAMALNLVSIALLYPMLVEMIQSGDYTAFLGSPDQGASTGSSTWG